MQLVKDLENNNSVSARLDVCKAVVDAFRFLANDVGSLTYFGGCG